MTIKPAQWDYNDFHVNEIEQRVRIKLERG